MVRALVLSLLIVSTARAEPVLSVYLPDYRVKAGDKPALYGTTHLVLFSAKPSPDGSVDFSRVTPELRAFAATGRQQNPDLKVTVCVGGWGRGTEFASAVATTETRHRFASELVAFCETHQLNGIDIDWEFPKGDKQHADLALFLELLSGKLKPGGRLLTIALNYNRPLPERCWQYVDQVNLMSYQPWHIEPYDAWLEKSVQLFLDSGLPKEKLIIGVGFFTKEKAGDRRAVSWKNIDNETDFPKSGHGYWPVGKQPCDLRIELWKKYGLGGVMVWDYGHDKTDPESSLLRYLSGQLGLTK